MPDYLFDAVVRAAVCEYDCERVAALPTEESLKEQFPVSKRSMRIVRRKYKEQQSGNSAPVFYLKKAVAACLVVVTVIFSLMLTSPEVRAGMYDAVLTWKDTYATFFFGSQSAPVAPSPFPEDPAELQITYIPEGFVLCVEDVLPNECYYMYQLGEMQMDILITKSDYSWIDSDTEHTEYEKITVNGRPAYLLTDTENPIVSVIIGDENLIVDVFTYKMDEETALRIAEGIK